MRRHGNADPHLPVGKQAMQGEFSGHARVGGKPPDAQHVGHKGHRNQQSRGRQSQSAIGAACLSQRAAPTQPYANDQLR